MSDFGCILIHGNRNWGGGETQLMLLAEGLRALRIPLLVLSEQDGRFFTQATQSGFNVYDRRHPPEIRGLPGWDSLPIVLHAHDSRSIDTGRTLKKRLNAPLIVSRKVLSPLRTNIFSRRKYSKAVIDRFIAIAPAVADEIIKTSYPTENIDIIPDAVDHAALSAMQANDEFKTLAAGRPLIGGVGALSKKKNWGLLIQTADILKQQGRDLCWVIVGKGEEECALRETINVAGLDGHVYLAGFREDAVAHTAAMDIFFFPSLMEGGGVSVLEAMSLGIPIAAADSPGLRDTVNECGELFTPDNPDSAAKAVCCLLDNTEHCADLTTKARDLVHQRNSIDVMVDATLTAYQTMLSGY